MAKKQAVHSLVLVDVLFVLHLLSYLCCITK